MTALQELELHAQLERRNARIQELERELELTELRLHEVAIWCATALQQRDTLAAAVLDLNPLITWLKNGCDVTAATHELGLLQKYYLELQTQAQA